MAICKAVLIFGDDYGDNECTFHCQLEEGHGGAHMETGDQDEKDYVMVWSGENEFSRDVLTEGNGFDENQWEEYMREIDAKAKAIAGRPQHESL